MFCLQEQQDESESEEEGDVTTPCFPQNVDPFFDLDLSADDPDSPKTQPHQDAVDSPKQRHSQLKTTSFTIRGKCATLMTSSRSTSKYKCEVCGQTFATRWVLTRHRLVHTPNKIKCHVCDKWFTRKDNLNYHVAKYHPPTLLHQHTPTSATPS